MRTLTRPELTAALAARQMLLDRQPLAPAEAIRRLTPLQGQDSPAPYFALAARLDRFTPADLEAAISSRSVVKTTIMRLTLHLAAAGEYPAYAQLTRQARMRTWRKTYAHLDEARVVAELGAWLGEPRTNDEIRERVRRYEGVADDPWSAVIFARTLVPLVQLPPAGFWRDRRRPAFVVDPRPGLTRSRLPRSSPPATWLPSAPPAVATSRAGPASRSATSPRPGRAWRPSPTVTSTAPSSSTFPAGRCRRRRRSCRCACWLAGTRRCSPTPTVSGSSRSRSDR